MFELKNKVAIVTGSARGIGRSIALALAKQGANIVVADVINGNQTVDMVKKLKRKSFFVKTDTSDNNSIENMVNECIKKFKKVDILVNNAGIFRQGLSESFTEEEWDKLISINLKGYFLCSKAVGKYMLKRKKGCILNISSIAGLGGFAQSAAYCSSKGGVILLTKTLAAEWGKRGIRVNAICPGLIKTPMVTGLLANKQFMKSLSTKVPLTRVGAPKDIAYAVLYLVSDEASFTTGHALVVDGGWTCSL